MEAVMKTIRILLAAAVFSANSMNVYAESAEMLEFFEEEAKVTTASRREQSIKEIPITVDVITAEEIKVSGATNIWDLMRFRAGMDVMDMRSSDGRRGTVAVRGFPQEFVHNLQVMVDGRSVYEPMSSGVYWDQLPISIDEIEHIEIIRGPNAALYGTGAGLGVINVITKKPAENKMAEVKVMHGNREFVHGGGLIEVGTNKLGVRGSYGYRESEGSPRAVGGSENDSMQRHNGHLRTRWQIADESELEFFTGTTGENAEFLRSGANEYKYRSNFQMISLSHGINAAANLKFLSARSNTSAKTFDETGSVVGKSETTQLDQEIVQQLKWGEGRMDTTTGFNYRSALVESAELLRFQDDPKMALWNAYINQSAKLGRQWVLVGGISWEESNVGDGDVHSNYQLASMWSPVRDHSFRVSYAVAHTIPTISATHINVQSGPSLLYIGNPELRPQHITSMKWAIVVPL
jgi:outer membrane cobalamin receptor